MLIAEMNFEIFFVKMLLFVYNSTQFARRDLKNKFH